MYHGIFKASFRAGVYRLFLRMSSLSTFRQSFKGDIVTPDDVSYTEAIARWARNAERPARVVAFVKDTNDVALALEYARANGLRIAIRGGGHSPSGASSAKDGVVIDLSRHLNYAVVDPEKRTVRVGGGTLWGTVEKEAIQHGLASVAGSVNHVCVSFRLVLHAVLTREQTGVSGYVLSLQLWSSCLMSVKAYSLGEVSAFSPVSMASLSITFSRYVPSPPDGIILP